MQNPEFSETSHKADRRGREGVHNTRRLLKRRAQEEEEEEPSGSASARIKTELEDRGAKARTTSPGTVTSPPRTSLTMEPTEPSREQDNPDNNSNSNNTTNFFDLPREVRDMIYAYFPYLASIHINQDPSIVAQPSISKVCQPMRKESLDVFYGKNNFFLDLRGWKSPSYPRTWTPRNIFESWITAIGNENAARLRSLSFFSHNFRVNIRVSKERPPRLVLKFRTSLSRAEIAEGAPYWYTFPIAARRAERGLRRLLDEVEAKTLRRGLSVESVRTICWAIDKIQPFLCRRTNLGYQGAVLVEEDVRIQQWPRTGAHLDKCDDCGYHRYTRGGVAME